MKIHRSIGLSVCVLMVLAIASPPALAAQAKTRVRYTQGGESLLFGPIYVARELGYFGDEGIELEALPMGAGAKVLAALVGGSLDIIQTSFPHIIKSYEEGVHLVAFASIFEQLGLDIALSNAALAKARVSPTDPLDARVRALRGIKLGISSAGSSTDTFARSLIRSVGMNPDTDVQLVPVGAGETTYAAFEAGRVDGFVYPLPFPQMAEARGLGRVLISATTGEVPEWKGLSYVVIAAPKTYLDENPKVIQGFTRALGRAMKFIDENPGRAREILVKTFPKIDQTALRISMETAFGAYAKSPVLSPRGYDLALKFLNASEEKQHSVPFEAVTTNGFAKPVENELGLRAR